MSASKIQLVGGNFQDAEGNLLSGGYLIFILNQDESVDDSQICAGREITIALDAFGDAVASPGQFIWGNDVMSPVNSYYRVTGYTANGQIAWGPNNQQIEGGPTFDLGSWLPNTVISWFPTLAGQVNFEINGAPSSSQSNQNLEAGSNVTITDLGSGNVSIAATFPPPTPPGVSAGMNVANTPLAFQNHGSDDPQPVSGYSWCQVQFANSIRAFPTKWTVSMRIATALSAPIVEMCLIRTIKDSLTTVDVTPITFGGSPTPLFNSTGTVTSDSISKTIDAAHDYYFCFTGNPFGGSGSISVDDFLNSSDWTSFGGNVNNSNALSGVWASSVGAGGGFGSAFPVGFGFYFLSGWNAA